MFLGMFWFILPERFSRIIFDIVVKINRIALLRIFAKDEDYKKGSTITQARLVVFHLASVFI